MTPLVGRSEFIAAVAGARAVGLSGAPGAGKTRLLTEFKAPAAESVIATIRCHRGVTAVYEPLEALARVAERVAGVSIPRRVTTAAGANDADRLLRLRERLEAIAAHAPVLLQIDDLHWAPSATLDAVAFCVDRTRDSAIRWQLATRPRPGLPDPFQALRGEPDCAVVDVPLLDEAQTNALARELGASHTDGVYRFTGGNPLYVEQWVRARSRPAATSTLRGMLEARLRDLPARDLSVAALAAVAERPLPLSHAAEALHERPQNVIFAVVEMETLGIVRVDDECVDFAHDLLREACFGLLDDGQLRSAHEAMLAIARDDAERGRHLAAAGRFAEAPAAYLAAARKALEGPSYLETAAIAERLRALPDLGADVLWQLHAIEAILYNAANGFPKERTHVDALLAQRDRVDSRTCAFYMQQFIAAVDLPHEGIGTYVIETIIDAADIDARDKGPFYAWRAKILFGKGAYAEGLATVEAALQSAMMPPESRFELRCLRALFLGLDAAGVADSRADLIALAQDPGNAAFAEYGFVYIALATLETFHDFDEARARWAKLGLACDRPIGSGVLYLHWAASALIAGRLGETLDVCAASEAYSGARGSAVKPSIRAVQIDALIWSGQLARAHAALEETRSYADHQRVAFARAALAEHEGDADIALRLYEDVAERCAGPDVFGARALTGIVRIRAARGDLTRARDAAERLLAGGSQTATSYRERAECEFYLALAAGDEARARECLAALEAARVAVPERALATLRFGERFRDRTAIVEAATSFERAGARKYAEDARRIARELGFRFGSRSQRHSALTERETDVARCVAEGKTNREIAATLNISPKTVAANIGAILGKCGLRSRVEIAANIASGRTLERI